MSIHVPATASRESGLVRKMVTTIQNWLVVGPDPKVRDSHNSAHAVSAAPAGVRVDDQSAMGLSAFFACARLIASTIGTMPIGVYRRESDGAAVPVTDAPLYKVLHNSPNADQTPLDYLEFVAISQMLRGDHFARKEQIGGRLVALQPIRPDIVTVYRRSDGTKGYRFTDNGEPVDLGEDEIFHVPGFGGGPLGGWSIPRFARQSLGIAIAAETSAAALYGNGVRPSGALSFKEWLKGDQRKEARELIEQDFAGAMNAGRPFILEGDARWESISLNAEDSQLLQSRSWSVEEMCRWFGVPPVLIGHNEKTTSWGSGIEQMLLWFLKFTLEPYLVRLEQSIRKQLLTPAERSSGLFVEFKREGLLRADSKARAEFYGKMTNIGAMTINEVRRLENLPPVEGGDVPRMQMQNVPITEADGLGDGTNGDRP